MIETLTIHSNGPQLLEITDEVNRVVADAEIDSGLCTLFIKHTSASLVIQENADYSVRVDLQNWLNRIVPEGDALYTHTAEGPDDMPAHIKSMLTSSSLSVPVLNGSLTLGTWQGIYLFEHRSGSHRRQVVIHLTR